MADRDAIATSRPRRITEAQLALALVVATLVVLTAALVYQLGDTAFIRGDGDLYLRDAGRVAAGDLPRSRYSPGFALFLAPILLVTDDPALAGNISLVVIAAVAVAALVLVYRFLVIWLRPLLAALAIVVLALNQGSVTYFAEVRPEALMLLLVTAMFLALRRERGWLAIALGAVAIVLRIAVLPLVVVTLAVWAWRRPRLLAAAAVLCGLALVVDFANQPSYDEDYLEIGGTAFTGEAGLSERGTAVLETARDGAVAYGRYGLPRFVWPYRVLASPAGLVLGPVTTLAMAAGLVVLVRRRGPPEDEPDELLLRAAVLGTAAYVAALLIWPMRLLAAIRLSLPIAPIALLGLGIAVLVVSRRLRPQSGALPLTLAALLAAVTVLGGATAVRDHAGDDSGGDGFVEAHVEAQRRLPPGRVVSDEAGATELLLHRTAFEYPFRQNIADFARRVEACTFVVTPAVGDATVAWIREHSVDTIAARGAVEIVTVDQPWCSSGGT